MDTNIVNTSSNQHGRICVSPHLSFTIEVGVITASRICSITFFVLKIKNLSGRTLITLTQTARPAHNTSHICK
jgi:hypothetical protein